MRVFARHSLIDAASNSAEGELLLEGSWPAAVRRPGRWSLDEAIDARHEWIDRRASELAERAAQASEVNFAYVNALALRYYLVKLLRVAAFFGELPPLDAGEAVELRLAANRDEPYAEVLRQIADARGARLDLHWHESPAAEPRKPARSIAWRRWAERAVRRRVRAPVRRDAEAPRVVLCGNPRILNPVCMELVARGCRVWWLYERFAVRCWWRWRGAGIEQLACDLGRSPHGRRSVIPTGGEMFVGGIDLAGPLEWWLSRGAAEAGSQQSSLIERVEKHFQQVCPTALVLDEDATPFKRIAAAAARRQGARSAVVQHGAPCGPFGFAPLAADEICVWGESSRRQLEAWGVPAERIRIAGWPCLQTALLSLKPTARIAGGGPRFLLLATVPPRDERPDNVAFHLTTDNHAAMLQMVCQTLRQIDGATLTIKPHPRTADGKVFAGLPLNDPALPVRIAPSGDLAVLLAQSDCVLSCASTAGIEAALAGAPVVQLLPLGCGDVLPAEDWGFVGSARTPAELTVLTAQALARGWQNNPAAAARVVAETGRQAAARIVDGLVGAAMRQTMTT